MALGAWVMQSATAKWCQHTPVQLWGCDGEVIAVDLEETTPEERTRSLPGLELNTVMERAYIISYSLLILFEIGSCLMAKYIFCTQQEDPSYPPSAQRMKSAYVNCKQPDEFRDELFCTLHVWGAVPRLQCAHGLSGTMQLRCPKEISQHISAGWEENTGFSHKAYIQQNATIDKHNFHF